MEMEHCPGYETKIKFATLPKLADKINLQRKRQK